MMMMSSSPNAAPYTPTPAPLARTATVSTDAQLQTMTTTPEDRREALARWRAEKQLQQQQQQQLLHRSPGTGRSPGSGKSPAIGKSPVTAKSPGSSNATPGSTEKKTFVSKLLSSKHNALSPTDNMTTTKKVRPPGNYEDTSAIPYCLSFFFLTYLFYFSLVKYVTSRYMASSTAKEVEDTYANTASSTKSTRKHDAKR